MNTQSEKRFAQEACDTLNRLYAGSENIDGMTWFFDLMYSRFNAENLKARKPDIIALGEDVPAELLYAFSDRPLFILGGSLETAHWADEMTPRDTDPVSRSMLGWLENPCFDLAKDAAIVMAASSDSRRKLASLLEAKGRRVFVLDVPPDQPNDRSTEKYTRQLIRLCAFLERETGRRLTRKRLWQVTSMLDEARNERNQMMDQVMRTRALISPSQRQMLAESLWFADNLKEWTMRMKLLNAALRQAAARGGNPPDRYPRILLTGSPVVFPNYKLPLLLEECGLRTEMILDAMTVRNNARFLRPKSAEMVNGLLRRIAERNLRADASGAYCANVAAQQALQSVLNFLPIDGIVCQVLKGQVEVDFELPGMEETAAEYGIPMIRLETDYQYQDVEQLRIRLEAFGEMLAQRRYETERMAG